VDQTVSSLQYPTSTLEGLTLCDCCAAWGPQHV